MLAIARPDLEVVLLEARKRKCEFIEEAARSAHTRARVVNERAEVAGRGEMRDSFDVATARAVAAMPVALEYCLPFVTPGGRAILLSTLESDEDLEALAPAARALGGGDPRWRSVTESDTDPRRGVLVVDKVERTPEEYPRRTGVPKKRPLR